LRTIRQQWTKLYNKIREQHYDSLVKQTGAPLPIESAVDFLEAIAEDAHQTWLAIAKKYRLLYQRESL
jgi:hypothetical protein